MKILVPLTFTGATLLGIAVSKPVQGVPPMTETAHFVYYKPAQPLGLALCFHPAGNAREAAGQFLPFADRYHLLVAGSKEFRNGPNDLTAIAEHVRAELIHPFSPDPRKSFCTGLSGGGQFSYSFLRFMPDQFAGVVVNTCRFNPQEKEQINLGKQRLARGKWAFMLASPTDFRYQEMEADRVFLEQHGWRVHWLEFSGGHAFAPEQVVGAALQSIFR